VPNNLPFVKYRVYFSSYATRSLPKQRRLPTYFIVLFHWEAIVKRIIKNMEINSYFNERIDTKYNFGSGNKKDFKRKIQNQQILCST